MFMCFVWLAVVIVACVGLWKVFIKMGKPGWAGIVPIYNVIILLEITGKPIWWIALFLIPIANLVAGILLSIAVAEKFGKTPGFGVGLALVPFVFYPILGFGDAQYVGAAGAAAPSIQPPAATDEVPPAPPAE